MADARADIAGVGRRQRVEAREQLGQPREQLRLRARPACGCRVRERPRREVVTVDRRQEPSEAAGDRAGASRPGILERVRRAAEKVGNPHSFEHGALQAPDVECERA